MTEPSGDSAVAEVVVIDHTAQELAGIMSNVLADPNQRGTASQLVQLTFGA